MITYFEFTARLHEVTLQLMHTDLLLAIGFAFLREQSGYLQRADPDMARARQYLAWRWN